MAKIPGLSRARAGKVLAALALLLFVACQLNRALYFPPYSDDAWMAVVARNLAFGYGWASSSNGLVPLDPMITTGPGLLGVVAAAIALFGNALWVPHLVAGVLNFSLFGVLLWRLHRWLPASSWYGLLLVLPLVFARVAPHLWFVCQGDMTAFLYVALSAIVLFEAAERTAWPWALLAGVLASAAVLTKLVALVAVTGMLAGWAWLVWQYPAWRRGAVAQGLALVAGFGPPLLAWQLYQQQVLASLGPEFSAAHAAYQAYAFVNTGSGVDGLMRAWHNGHLFMYVLENTWHNARAYTHLFSAQFPLVPWFLLIIAGLLPMAWQAWRARQSAAGRMLFFTAWPAAAYLAWALMLGDVHFGRFLYIGLFLALIPVLGALGLYHRRAWLVVAGCLLLEAVVMTPRDAFFGGTVYGFKRLPSEESLSLQDMVQHLQTEFPRRRIASCTGVYAHEIDYLMPQPGLVTDCQYLLGQVLVLDDQAYAAKYFPEGTTLSPMALQQDFVAGKQRQGDNPVVAPVRWTGPMDFLVVINPQGHYLKNFGREPFEYAPIRQYCQPLSDDGLYALLDCREQDLHRAIDARGGLWFYPPQWGAEKALYGVSRYQPLSASNPRKITAPTQ